MFGNVFAGFPLISGVDAYGDIKSEDTSHKGYGPFRGIETNDIDSVLFLDSEFYKSLTKPFCLFKILFISYRFPSVLFFI